MPISRDYLVQEFMLKERPTLDIAMELGVTDATVRYWVKKHGFKPRGLKETRANNRKFYRKLRQDNPQSTVNRSEARKAVWAKVTPEERSRIARERWNAIPPEKKVEMRKKAVASTGKLGRSFKQNLRDRGDLINKHKWFCMARLRTRKVAFIFISAYYANFRVKDLAVKLAGCLEESYSVVVVKSTGRFVRHKALQFYDEVYRVATDDNLGPITVLEYK